METVYDGLTSETHRYPETVSGGLSSALVDVDTQLISKSVRNLSGTLRESWSPDPTSTTAGALVKSSSSVTSYKPAAGLSTRSVTNTPDNFTQTTDSFLDGRTAKTTGDLSPGMQYAHSVNPTGELTSQSYLDGANLRETTTSQTDSMCGVYVWGQMHFNIFLDRTFTLRMLSACSCRGHCDTSILARSIM